VSYTQAGYSCNKDKHVYKLNQVRIKPFFQDICSWVTFVLFPELKMQTFLSSPKFDKKYIYKNPTNMFEKFTNAFVYYKIVSTGTPDANKKALCEESNKEWRLIKKCSEEEIEDKINRYLNTPLQLRGCLTLLKQRSDSMPQLQQQQ
jgi:hypothetical protein